jgi:type 2A phosphatase activator TIP41
MTQEGIPFERLSPENPIKHFGQIYLYECDLEDCGYVMSQVRFRVMDDCFYIMLRMYFRCDGVCVRLLDTRIFHDFASGSVANGGKPVIIR